MDALRNARRLHATVSFVADTGLKGATDLGGSPSPDLSLCSRLTVGTVHNYNQLMKDFPLNDILSSIDLDKVHKLLTINFSHLNRKLKLSNPSSSSAHQSSLTRLQRHPSLDLNPTV
jgi:hypothetical protein